ncbi:MAG TPA: 30S ribosomal protein S6 [Planctomycetota bacterium]|nr:30S ribosomal protein S6 [Planctomycetota bacterium]
MADAPAAPATATATAPAPVVPPTPTLPAGTRLYECMWVVDANTGREDYNKVVTGLKEIVEKGGGAWINGDKWEERRLAYPIKKKKRGLYIISHFSAPTDNVIKIDRQAKLSDLVLRHMITVDEDGLTTTPPVRGIDDDDFSGPGGGGGERRFFGGGGNRFGGGGRPDRGDRPERTERSAPSGGGASGPGATGPGAR